MNKNYLQKLVLVTAVASFSFQLQAQNRGEIRKLKGKYDLKKLQTIQQSFKKKATSEKKQAMQMAKQRGWKTKFTTNDGRYVELQRVVDGKPIYYTTFNAKAAKSTRANHLNAGGSLGLNLMGQGLTAHVWDGGLARTTHQEYDGAGGTNRFSIGDGTTKRHYHAAHVTGTIMASGVKPEAKGMAPHAKAIGYDWNSDKTEATAAASNGMLISNHSYGYATRNNQGQVQLPQYYFGGYIDESRAWDQILFNAPNYLMVVAAGNDGGDDTANNNPTGGYGFDKLTGHSTSKNNLVVANAQDANVDTNGNLISVSINSSSSEGPTDDFRIKPDITGNGTSVYSTYESSDTAYNSITGTSMASPNVTGTLMLLQQHYNNLYGNFMKAATLKGLALHTADDAGASGPDAVFGWGLLNAKKAAETISKKGNNSKIEELTLTSGQSYTITVDADGTNPLFASISWTDRPGTAVTSASSAPVLVNDLDIRVSKNGTSYKPYKLTGATTSAKKDNNVDPYERVDIANASGTYTITVTHKGSLTGGSQNFSLIVTGITGTPVNCTATVPTAVTVNGASATSANVSWNAVAGASYDVRYRKVGATSWATNAVTTTSTSLSGLEASSQYEVQVRSKCANGTNSSYSASVNFSTTDAQLNYCDSKGDNSSDEYIQKVELGSISNTSGASNGYTDHTSVSTNLAKNVANTITITPKWSGTTYDEGYAVFIDYNQDGDFSDNGETVFTKAASKTTPVSGSFTVPNSATAGATRMRVVMQYNAVPSACGSYKYGETEDYTVVIGGAGQDTEAPTVPTNVTATNLTQTSAKINWSASTDNVGVKEYNVYRGANKLGSVTTTSADVSGLTASTSYTFSVSAVDEAGNESAKGSVTFTTPGNSVSYCTSKSKSSSYEWIDYVAFGGMTNSTGSDGGYGDYTNKVANVSRGVINTLVISAGFKSTAYDEYWAVYIDYNQNGTFDDGERVASGNSTSADNLSADITIPADAKLGNTRMRISMKYKAAQTACETFDYGEVEDYTVNIGTAGSSFNTTFANVSATALQKENNSNLAVYPNPAKASVEVQMNSREKATYRIVNTIGQTVKSGVLVNRNLNVSGLQNGMYLLEVNDGQKLLTTKLIKK